MALTQNSDPQATALGVGPKIVVHTATSRKTSQLYFFSLQWLVPLADIETTGVPYQGLVWLVNLNGQVIVLACFATVLERLTSYGAQFKLELEPHDGPIVNPFFISGPHVELGPPQANGALDLSNDPAASVHSSSPTSSEPEQPGRKPKPNSSGQYTYCAIVRPGKLNVEKIQQKADTSLVILQSGLNVIVFRGVFEKQAEHKPPYNKFPVVYHTHCVEPVRLWSALKRQCGDLFAGVQFENHIGTKFRINDDTNVEAFMNALVNAIEAMKKRVVRL